MRYLLDTLFDYFLLSLQSCNIVLMCRIALKKRENAQMPMLHSIKHHQITTTQMSDNTDNKNALPTFDTSQFTMLPMSRIELNEGQLPGLPTNPRQIRKKKFEKLKQNIERYPEMLIARSLLVYPIDESDSTQYVIIGGNMRYRAMSELKHDTAPVFIIPHDTPVERLQAYTILDNGDFGSWDWDLLANEWDESDLTDWGVKIPGKGDGEKDLSDRIDLEYKIEIDCGDEATQEELFNNLTEQGYKCRLLTL